MSNMSYCRFQNTLGDLQDCRDALEFEADPLSAEETRAAVRLINLCKEIAEAFEELESDEQIKAQLVVNQQQAADMANEER